jgi:hypothetical protein
MKNSFHHEAYEEHEVKEIAVTKLFANVNVYRSSAAGMSIGLGYRKIKHFISFSDTRDL